MFSESSAYRVRITSAIALFVLIFSQLYIPIAGATTNGINFSTSSNYTYDTNKILVSGGQAQLKIQTAVAWYDVSWSSRKPITITGNGGALTNYQTKIVIPFAAGMQANFNDLRFTASDGTTTLNYWLESKTDSVTSTVWVNIPSVPASPGTTTVYMYYGNSVAPTASNGSSTFTFFDDFAGISTQNNLWNNFSGNPLLSPSTSGWESTLVGDPWVIYDATSSMYQMWYYGYNVANAGVGYATSPDGVSWIKYAGNPVLTHSGSGYDSLYAHKPSVVIKNGVYYMYYSADNGSVRTIAVATSTSPQGPFTKYAANPIVVPTLGFENNFLDAPSVMYDTDVNYWKMWFSCGTNLAGEPTNWCYATSTDGYSWAKYANNPIAVPPGDGSFISKSIGGMNVSKIAGVYQVYYNGFDDSGVSRIGYSTSTDGITWNPKATDMILDVGAAGTWNSGMMYRPNVITVNGQKQMWYNARSLSYPGEQIGTAFFATSSAVDSSKWNLINPGRCSVGILSGNLILNELGGGGGDTCVLQTASYIPANSVVIENRVKTVNIIDTGLGQTQYITFTDFVPFAGASQNNQFLFSDQGTHNVKHQSKYNNGWGGEDQVYGSFPNTGTWYQTQAVKKSTGIDWSFLDDALNVLGSLIGNTDNPTNFSFPVAMGARGTENAVDWFRVRQYTSSAPSVVIQSADAPYDTGNPSITLNAGASVPFTTLSGFSESAVTNSGAIQYQISNDAGTTWYWYNSGWATTTSGYTQTSSASSINTNIATLPHGSGQFVFRAYLHSNGFQFVQLSSVTLTYTYIVSPTVVTSSPTSVTSTSVTLNAAITSDGGASSTIIGFNYGLTASYGSIASSTGTFGAGPFSQVISNLTPSTTYHYQAYATNVAGTATTSDNSFTTSAVPAPAPQMNASTASVSSGGSQASYDMLASILAPSPATTAYLNSLKNPGSLSTTQVSTRDLTLGSRGEDVRLLQVYLNSHGYQISQTGAGSSGHETALFGSLTQKALARFQKANGIKPAVGYFGPLTRRVIAALGN
ncbi:MAG: DUF2341 domain-containing protein [bacterium]